MIGRPDLITDERFVNDPLRSKNRDALNAIIETQLRQRRNDEWIKDFNTAGVPCGESFSPPSPSTSSLSS